MSAPESETLKAIEGYLANKADKGDELARNLHRMLLNLGQSKRLFVVEANDGGTAIQEFPSETARLEYLAGQDDAFNDFYCLDVSAVSGDVDEIRLAETGSDATLALNELQDRPTQTPRASA